MKKFFILQFIFSLSVYSQLTLPTNNISSKTNKQSKFSTFNNTFDFTEVTFYEKSERIQFYLKNKDNIQVLLLNNIGNATDIITLEKNWKYFVAAKKIVLNNYKNTNLPKNIQITPLLHFVQISNSKINMLTAEIMSSYKIDTIILTDNFFLSKIENTEIINSKLIYLKINGSDLKTFPKVLYKLYQLENLTVSHSRIIKIDTLIKNISNLKNLDLSNNNIDTIPKEMGHLYKLETLNLSNNRIKKIPNSFQFLSNLKTLDLRNNSIQSIPIELYKLHNLTEVHLDKSSKFYLKSTIRKIRKLNPFIKFIYHDPPKVHKNSGPYYGNSSIDHFQQQRQQHWINDAQRGYHPATTPNHHY